MNFKSLLMLLFLILSFSQAQESQIWGKKHKDIPKEIKGFFEGEKWIEVIDSNFHHDCPIYKPDSSVSTILSRISNGKKRYSILDYTIYKPDFFTSAQFTNIVSDRTKDIANARGCLIQLQNRNSYRQYWFIKDINTGTWTFKEVHFPPPPTPKPAPKSDTSLINIHQYRMHLEKPIIYLYPKEPTDIHVSLNFYQHVTYAYPKYPSKGWNLQAFSDGTLVDKETGSKYYSLFWEGTSHFVPSFSEGYNVPNDSVEVFLEEKLSYLGLNFKERQEFIVYWAPRIKGNPFSLIHFSTTEYVKNFPLSITPTPDTQIRVYMVFKECTYDTVVPVQSLVKGERKGFTVIEWGGTDLDRGRGMIQ